ncbi:MAG: L-rhamnose isomerase [Planctomycetota bacterium]|jgi:L-rhamnose isomerase|nr:L-rhamnose isomerase [Planctomycetota bacterium]
MSRFETAKAMYGEMGVDVDAALAALSTVSISMHCWQGDDVNGFEKEGGASGGIAATGHYPGRARNADELFSDIDRALTLIPGKHRLNIHAIYTAPYEGADRDKLEPRHFARWVEFAKQRGLGIDFNPTFFSHPKAADNLTLSHPDDGIRKFWVEHGKCCRRIAAFFGKELGTPSLNNVWIPDGYKNIPADRIGPRRRLQESLNELFSEELDRKCVRDAVESKVFGLGVEAYTVGSHEFYLNYAAWHDLLCLLDVGHYHPTETISDKISAMLLFYDLLALHVSRPVRWDSDHVIILDDELRAIGREIVRCNALSRTLLALDFFDASINRVAAWVIGMRNMQKAILAGLLLPNAKLTALQDEGNLGDVMAIEEELKLYPMGDVWDHFCETNGVPQRSGWMDDVRRYEKDVLARRG